MSKYPVRERILEGGISVGTICSADRKVLDLGRKTYRHETRKTLITLELLDGFTSCKDRRVVRERGLPAPSARKRLLADIILYGGQKRG